MLVPENYPDRTVCVMGLGYVGLTLACTMADLGFNVLGIEIRPEVVDMLKEGRPHFFEPGLEDQLRRVISEGRLTVSRTFPAGAKPPVFIITVGTPLSADGVARMDMIANISHEVAEHLPAGALVIMRSTVKIGTTRKVVKPILDATGKDYDLAFCPERTLEGQALVELRQLPQIVGGASMRANIRASQLFQMITPTVVRVPDVETAEMIKLVDNAQRDVIFAYANEVARMCDAVGISAYDVISAGKLGYPRTNLPMPGTVGGPCLEKDPHILAEGLREYGLDAEITLTARRLNERQPAETVAGLQAYARSRPGFPAAPVITLAGLAFKGRPATDDLRGTTAKPILAALRKEFPDAQFRGYDAVVSAADIQAFGLDPAPSLAAAFAGANLVVIANNHPSFTAMPITQLAATMAKPGVIYDYWSTFSGRDIRMPANVTYMALGSHGKPVEGK